jgi:hypothetical protein
MTSIGDIASSVKILSGGTGDDSSPEAKATIAPTTSSS